MLKGVLSGGLCTFLSHWYRIEKSLNRLDSFLHFGFRLKVRDFMELFQWKSEYDLGLPKIDEQHRKIVEMLNKLYAAKRSDAVQQVIKETLAELVAYTKVHFEDEEAAMLAANYPALKKQCREHQAMTDQVFAMCDRLERGDEPATFELLNFMNEWLKNHVTGSDREFGEFMRDQAVTAEIARDPDKSAG
jgi:hemerythrin